MVMLASSYLFDFVPFQNVRLEITLACDELTHTPILTIKNVFRLSIDEMEHPIWRIEILQNSSAFTNIKHEIRCFLRQIIEQPLDDGCCESFSHILSTMDRPEPHTDHDGLCSIPLPYLNNHAQALNHPLYNSVKKIQFFLKKYFTHPTVLPWYFICYQKFNSRSYYFFEQWAKPAIQHLQRWEHEHPNRLAWFLFSQDLTHVESLNFFRYQDFVHYDFLGETLFSSQNQIQQFFALAPAKFQHILMLLFHSDLQQPYFAKILIQAYLTYPLPILTHLQLWKMRAIFPPETLLDQMYLKQYVHAFYLIFQLLNQPSEDEQHLHDFLFGMQIQDFIYTDKPNIALLHSKMTLKSLIQQSKKWYQQSQMLEVAHLQFDFQPYQYQKNHCRFELISNFSQLRDEAEQMQHCILTYAQRIAQKHYLCFRVYYGDFRATLGLIYHPQQNSYEFHQCVGLQNQGVPQVLEHLAKQFSAYLNQQKIFLSQNINLL